MKPILLFISVAILGGLFCTPLFAEEKREPRYKGKALGYWVERLQKCEKDEEIEAAARAIAAFGPDAAPAVPALVEMLDDRSDEFRKVVGDILHSMGPSAKSAVPALIESLKEKTARSPRITLFVLSGIEPEAKDILPVLIASLDDRELRDQAAEAIYKLGPAAKDAIPTIRRAIRDSLGNDKDLFHVRTTFITPLPKLESAGISLLIELLSEKEAIGIQQSSADTLSEIGPLAKEAVPALTKLLQHDAPSLRLSAASALWKIDKNSAGVPILIALVKQSTVPALQTKQPPNDGKAPPIPMLSESDEQAVQSAKILGDIGPAAKSAIPELEKALSVADFRVRSSAIEAIEKIDPEAARRIKDSQKAEPRK